ncbi:MAG: hypothetical protein N4A38_05330 [Candidatus Gracilibacteria bacterium]|nr:hypothetical protein [Candidatus Gracilibacteria bacterium]
MITTGENPKFTPKDYEKQNFGKMIDKALADNVLDKDEAKAILDSYNKNRNKIIIYTAEQLAKLQDALGFSTDNRNKLFKKTEFMALKKLYNEDETGIKLEPDFNLKKEDFEVKEDDGKIHQKEDLEKMQAKRHVRLWSADNSINLYPLEKGGRKLRFTNADKMVLEYTGKVVSSTRREVIVGTKRYSIYHTSFVETKENIKEVNGELFANLAKQYLGRKYDSVYEKGTAKDGFGKISKNGEYKGSYKNGERYTTKEKPLVCSDLIREVLIASGLELSFLQKAHEDPFDVRRVSKLEEFLPNEPGFSMEKINGNTKYKVGDFVTTSTYNPKTKKENRHIGIVTEIGQNGEPLKTFFLQYGRSCRDGFLCFYKKVKI